MSRRFPPLSEESRRLIHQKNREKSIRGRSEYIAGRDLVAITLSNDPGEVLEQPALRRAVLGKAAYAQDERDFVKRISNGTFSSYDYVIGAAMKPDGGRLPALLDIFKLIICDARCLEEGVSLQDAYDTQLQEEELQTPTERAREIVRSEDEKMARRNARLIIPHLERISAEKLMQMERDEGNAIEAIWKQISPPPPAWIQQIVDAQQPWGFVFYKSREVERKYGHVWDEDYMWDTIQENTNRIPYSFDGERSLGYTLLHRIHSGGNEPTLTHLWTTDWTAGPISQDLSEDDALRRQFKDYRESLSSPGILRNTFIMIDDEDIPEDLWKYSGPARDTFWVWAYDADWEPSSTDVTFSNGEEYRGRVKVPIYSLDAWFYAARYEGVSLKDMWLKAQTHPSKLWICRSKPMENWDHESYI
ncbi:hypothetical protein G7Z17_g1328 [Cylindrodendrum hubeiense]|uniref:Uncharacterized protein n=1 Tax=Cylindrodendrum hubeiense TaxID=595255 RepID=A0A9P5HG82_9HYPO|nr:hypothetical protein G7Z17_g1328 [Cylindrodendrum hubeiense]